jgi:outer membrane protein assembly factor BamB
LSQQSNDFSIPTYYTVTAEDGTSRTYRVFAGMNRSVFVTSDDGYLYSINAVDGTQQWKYYVGASAVPTYSNGTVFVAGHDNVVYALNATDGSLKWSSTPPQGSYSLTIPAANNNKVYFAGSGYLNYPNSIYAHYVGFVYALNSSTGNQEWLDSIVTNDCRPTNVTVKDNIACVYDIMNGLFVYNASDGTGLWNTWGDMLGRANAAIANNTIIYANEAGLAAFNESNGQKLWQLFTPATNPVLTSTTISNNAIYSVGIYNSTLYAIDMSGTLKWQSYMGTASYSAPFIYNNNLYVLDSGKGLNCYASDNGSLKWRKTSFASQPIVTNSDIYVCTDNKQIACLNAATGDTKWISQIAGNFSQNMCVVDGNNNAYHITDSGEQQ